MWSPELEELGRAARSPSWAAAKAAAGKDAEQKRSAFGKPGL